jgi:hypothetical protein
MTSPNVSKKRFDCVEMMHQGAARVRQDLAGKSLEQQAAYWRERTQALLERQAKLRAEEHQLRAQR